MEVAGGQSYGLAGPYEKLVGKVHFAVDPKAANNRAVVDLGLAPRNERGQVEFSADFCILKPKDPARGNDAVLFEVSNRGGKGMLSFFNRAAGSLDPSTPQQMGDGFLLRHGFTLAWVGWQWDVPRREGLMRLTAPVAKEGDRPITGLVRADFVLAARQPHHSLADREHVAYPVLDPESAENVLTVRDTLLGPRRTVARRQWRFARVEQGKEVPDPTFVALEGGFQPGKIYEVVYRAQDPVVVGLGLAAVRDFVSALKNQTDAPARARLAYGFGVSQSGRFLRHFLYQGFNQDERERQVFDGLLCHVAGGGRGSFNHRFAQASRDAHPFSAFFYPTDVYPFADLPQEDPEPGSRADAATEGDVPLPKGILVRSQEQGALPKVFYTNSSYEYWGRAASLIHTTLDGRADAPLMDNVRVYQFAGSQHGPAGFPPAKNGTQQTTNPNDFRWSMRALLLAMDRWVRDGTPPPPSRYPRIADGTLVPVKELRFPKIPGVQTTDRIHYAYRMDYGPDWKRGIVSAEPPKVGKPFAVLVPQVDADGNEVAGVRMPEVTVPLATYTGWNLRDAATGAAEEFASMQGSFLGLPRNPEARQRAGDPRASILELYPSREVYFGRYAQATRELVRDGYLLPEDMPALLDRAETLWEALTGEAR